jgi:hypothetical protein
MVVSIPQISSDTNFVNVILICYCDIYIDFALFLSIYYLPIYYDFLLRPGNETL